MKFIKLRKNILVTVLLFLGLLIALVPSLYFYQKYQSLKKSSQTNQISTEEVRTLLTKVSSHIELPKNEEPTIATVSNKDAIKNQPFFSQAENQDKVIIFTKAKKAILYRPSIDKIIDVSSVNIGSQSGSVQSVETVKKPDEKIKVAIYNGSKVSGLAAATEKKLLREFKSIEVVNKTNTNGDYSKNLIVDLTGKNKDLIDRIIQSMDGEAGPLPAAEIRPNADILIIAAQE